MSGRRVRAIAVRILEERRNDRRTLALLFVAPIVILSLFYVLIRGGSSSPGVDVVNLDTGPLGAIVAGSIQHSSQVDAVATGLDRAVADLDDGGIAGYVVLPAGFSAGVASGGPIAPEVHLEGTQPGLNQPVLLAVNQSLAAASDTVASIAHVRVPHVEVAVDYLHGGSTLDTLDYFGAGFIGLVVFFFVFVITIVSFLRERSQGTLERLMATPLRRGDVVVGYMAGFAVLAVAQSLEVLLFTLYVLHVHNDGNVALIFLLTLLMTLMAVNLGIFLSMFARTEFQAVQFIPLAIVPQVLLSGIVFPVSTEPHWLQYVSNVLPLTYAVGGLRCVMLKGSGLSSGSLQGDLLVMTGFVAALVVAAVATLRREVA
jgi:ABC-2 type transport system permease protein